MKTLMFFLFLPFVAWSQTSGESKTIRSAIYFQSGFHLSDFKKINETLKDSGYAELSSMSSSKGFGYQLMINQWILNGSFYKIMQCKENADEACSHINFNSYNLGFGYSLLKKENILFFPMIELGRNKTEFFIADNEIPEQAMLNYLTGSPNVTQVTRFNLSSTLSLNFDAFFPLRKSGQTKLLAGIKAGYQINLTEGTWYEHEDEVKLSNGPKTNPVGFFGMFKLGFCF
jgi:hypothetical protein